MSTENLLFIFCDKSKKQFGSETMYHYPGTYQSPKLPMDICSDPFFHQGWVKFVKIEGLCLNFFVVSLFDVT